MYNTIYHTCLYNRLPEDKPAVSKNVADIKNQKIKDLTAVTDSSHDDIQASLPASARQLAKCLSKGKL
jgi:hypothetical protein